MTIDVATMRAANECVATAIALAINGHRGSSEEAVGNEFVLAVLKTIVLELSGELCTDGDGKIRRCDRSEPVDEMSIVEIAERFERD